MTSQGTNPRSSRTVPESGLVWVMVPQRMTATCGDTYIINKENAEKYRERECVFGHDMSFGPGEARRYAHAAYMYMDL